MSTRNKNMFYILDAKIQKQRLKDMKNAASKRNIPVSDSFCPGVTHVVTEFKEYEAVLRNLGISDVSSLNDVEVVSVQWFADCMRAGKVVCVEPKHRLQGNDSAPQRNEEVNRPSHPPALADYGCQRATPLRHQNEKYTKALETLEKHAELRDGDNDYSRALAFRRASCMLKSLPFALSSIQQLRNITNIGDHSKRVIQEILEDGECLEVENILKDPWFHKMKMFDEIFGIGPATAKQFIAKGWSSIEEVRTGYKSADWKVQWGLGFHEDLTTPVLRQEAHYIYEQVLQHLSKVLPGAIAKVTGGFRRGKTSGHDVDILITHPTEDRIMGALPRLLHSLESTDTVLCGRLEHSTYNDDVLSRNTKLSTRGQLDHFEKWIGIIKVPKKVRNNVVETNPNSDFLHTGLSLNSDCTNSCMEVDQSSKLNNVSNQAVQDPENHFQTKIIYSRNDASDNTEASIVDLEADQVRDEVQSLEGSIDDSELKCGHVKGTDARLSDKIPAEVAAEHRNWRARRVDLIIAPYSQYYYALVGWTGSKQFNRDARTYSERKLNMKLTSHGLYDFNLGKKIPASSEKEVFDNLKLPFHQPWERNC